ncbi:hypothetical protein ACLB2K_064410 [Fragaria x ananassa]
MSHPHLCSNTSAHFKNQIPPKVPSFTTMSIVTDELRAKADELYHGDAICQEKSKFLLTEMGLPNGLLPMKDMVECGYIKDTGFVWLKQKKSTTHKFEKVGRLASYATEITAYIEKGKIKKVTGVKTKEILKNGKRYVRSFSGFGNSIVF